MISQCILLHFKMHQNGLKYKNADRQEKQGEKEVRATEETSIFIHLIS